LNLHLLKAIIFQLESDKNRTKTENQKHSAQKRKIKQIHAKTQRKHKIKLNKVEKKCGNNLFN